MACDAHFRDIDVKTSLLVDWQNKNDGLPLIPQPTSEYKSVKTGRQIKPTSSETKSGKNKHQIWKLVKKDVQESDEEQLIGAVSRDDLNDLYLSRDVNSTPEREQLNYEESNDESAGGAKSRDTQSSADVRKTNKTEVGRNRSDEGEWLTDEKKDIDLVLLEESRDPTTSLDACGDTIPSKSDDFEKDGYENVKVDLDKAMMTNYITAVGETSCQPEAKDVTTKLLLAEEEVTQSLHDAIAILDDKKIFLLKKLHKLKLKHEKAREKAKSKILIQVLKSPWASQSPASDSENDLESVFVRKKVIRMDKRKMELKLMAEIDLILSKAQNIALTTQKIKYMTPCLEAKISADVDSDEETPDLVDVLSVTIGDKTVVMTTDFKNASLKSFCYVHGEVVRSVLKFDNSPWGVTRTDMNTVAVSIPLANKLCLVDVSTGVRLVETVRTKKQYYGLVSIGSNLVVATSPYSNPRSVDTLDLNGSVLKTMVIDTLLQQPSFICTTPSGGFVLSDLSKGALLGVTNTLELGRGFEIGDDAQLQSSRGVTANQNGDIFVVDYRQKKVKVFSGQGRFIKDILTSAETLKYPYGICFDNRGHLFVTDGGVIKIFSY